MLKTFVGSFFAITVYYFNFVCFSKYDSFGDILSSCLLPKKSLSQQLPIPPMVTIVKQQPQEQLPRPPMVTTVKRQLPQQISPRPQQTSPRPPMTTIVKVKLIDFDDNYWDIGCGLDIEI